MARKRYVSTNISTDEKVMELAERAGPFAVILYTWMIPHAADDGTITGRPRELKMLVVPGLDMSTADVAGAVAAMVDLGLIEHYAEGVLRFPTRTFHTYQAYVKPDRRGAEIPDPTPEPPAPPRDSPQNGAIPRTSGKSLASSSFSSSPSFSDSPSPTNTTPDGVARTPLLVVERVPVPKPPKTPNQWGQLIEKVRALDPEVELFGEAGRNGVRLRENASTLNLDTLAEAVVARAHGDWTTPYLEETGGPVWAFIGELGKFVAWKRETQRAAELRHRAEVQRQQPPPPPIRSGPYCRPCELPPEVRDSTPLEMHAKTCPVRQRQAVSA